MIVTHELFIVKLYKNKICLCCENNLNYIRSAPILFFCRIFEFLKFMERARGTSFSVLDVVSFAVSSFSSLLIFPESVFEKV